MALTLPYPDMVFVPLDILTAEEQNQLVGNIEFLANQFPLAASNIANGAIGSDQLAAGAVKSNNVDWATTFPYHIKRAEGATFTTTEKVFDTWTVAVAGTYYLSFNACGNSSSEAATIKGYIRKNGSIITQMGETTKDGYSQFIATTIEGLSAGDQLQASYLRDAWGNDAAAYGQWSFLACRVA